MSRESGSTALCCAVEENPLGIPRLHSDSRQGRAEVNRKHVPLGFLAGRADGQEPALRVPRRLQDPLHLHCRTSRAVALLSGYTQRPLNRYSSVAVFASPPQGWRAASSRSLLGGARSGCGSRIARPRIAMFNRIPSPCRLVYHRPS